MQFAGARPALGGAQHDQSARPAARPHRYGGLLADRQDLADGRIPSPRPSPGASASGSCPSTNSGFPAVSPASDAPAPGGADPGPAGWGLAIFVAVQVQHRQHGAVADRVEELVDVPGGGQKGPVSASPSPTQARASQVGVVEDGATGVGEHVTEFTALMDRAGRFRVQWLPMLAGEGELLEKAAHPSASWDLSG